MPCQGPGSRNKYRHKGNIMISHKEHGHPLEGLPATVGEVTEMTKRMRLVATRLSSHPNTVKRRGRGGALVARLL